MESVIDLYFGICFIESEIFTTFENLYLPLYIYIIASYQLLRGVERAKQAAQTLDANCPAEVSKSAALSIHPYEDCQPVDEVGSVAKA